MRSISSGATVEAARLKILLHEFMTVDSPSESPHSNGASPVPKPTYDEIALRAYFLALDRHRRGDPSDPEKDWTEAEQQLRPADSTIGR